MFEFQRGVFIIFVRLAAYLIEITFKLFELCLFTYHLSVSGTLLWLAIFRSVDEKYMRFNPLCHTHTTFCDDMWTTSNTKPWSQHIQHYKWPKFDIYSYIYDLLNTRSNENQFYVLIRLSCPYVYKWCISLFWNCNVLMFWNICIHIQSTIHKYLQHCLRVNSNYCWNQKWYYSINFVPREF